MYLGLKATHNQLDQPPMPPLITRIVSGGDILRACPDSDGKWILENNGECGGITTAGAGNNEGPGGGEYYYEERYTYLHEETALGALAQLYGSGEVNFSIFDTHTIYGGGTAVFNNANPNTKVRQYELYRSTIAGTAGKGLGLGDLEVLCEPAPLEIGNYVWFDINADGIQDPNESVLSGVTVRIYDMDAGNTLVGTAITDSTGHYYFGGINNTNITGPSGKLDFNTNYEVRIDLNDPALGGLKPTGSNKKDNDLSDSDGIVSGSSSVAAFNSNEPGYNNHNYDFGFTVEVEIGNYVWLDEDQNGIQDTDENSISGVTVNLYDLSGTLLSSTITNSNGFYYFDEQDGLVPNSQYIIKLDNPLDYQDGGSIRWTKLNLQ